MKLAFYGSSASLSNRQKPSLQHLYSDIETTLRTVGVGNTRFLICVIYHGHRPLTSLNIIMFNEVSGKAFKQKISFSKRLRYFHR